MYIMRYIDMKDAHSLCFALSLFQSESYMVAVVQYYERGTEVHK